MNTQEITVVYQWTANPGQAEALKGIYREVENQVQTNEPDAIRVACFFEEGSNTLVVVDVFKHADALGLHLSTTAAGHFGNLLQIATPGPFLFCGEVPEPLQQAAVGMGLNATFAPMIFGFDRGQVRSLVNV